MSELLREVHERTQLAGTNRLELLLFTLEGDTPENHAETFGINVFKVREIMQTPEISKVPGQGDSIKGVVTIRDIPIPIVNLAHHCGITPDEPSKLLLVTEYNGQIQGFLVYHIDRIVRLDWRDITTVPKMMESQKNGMVTALTEVPEVGLVQLLDVEKAIADISGSMGNPAGTHNLAKVAQRDGVIVFADDSSIARRQIRETLEEMNLPYVEAKTGLEGWQALDELASQATAAGLAASSRIMAILTDIEMPEMDGFTLTKQIKNDPRFRGIPVIIHSSLSGRANEELGKSVGVDAYVPKFNAEELAKTLADQIG